MQAFTRVLEYLIALCLAGMVIMVFGNVVLRFGFNSGITVSEELSRWLFVWMSFLGALVALKERAHLGTDFLVSRLSRKGKLVCLALSQLLMLAVTLMLLKGSWAQAQINWSVEAPVTGFSMAWVYGVGVVFAVPASLILLHALARTLSGRVSDAELDGTVSSEEAPK
jgi:TRAP-type transport system small permease protein